MDKISELEQKNSSLQQTSDDLQLKFDTLVREFDTKEESLLETATRLQEVNGVLELKHNEQEKNLKHHKIVCKQIITALHSDLREVKEQQQKMSKIVSSDCAKDIQQIVIRLSKEKEVLYSFIITSCTYLQLD